MPNDRADESSHKFRDDESLLLTLQLESSASQRGGCGHTDRAAVRRHLPGNDDDVDPDDHYCDHDDVDGGHIRWKFFRFENNKEKQFNENLFFADRRSYLLEGQRASVKWMSGDGKCCDLSSNQRWQRELDISLSGVRSYHHDSTCDFMCPPLISA